MSAPEQKILEIEDFTELVGTTFTAQLESHQLEMEIELSEVVSHKERNFDYKNIRKRPFSLILKRKDIQKPILSATYTLSHPTIGTYRMLLEPNWADEDGVTYQACFG